VGQARRLDLEDLVRCRHVAGVVEMDITRSCGSSNQHYTGDGNPDGVIPLVRRAMLFMNLT